MSGLLPIQIAGAAATFASASLFYYASLDPLWNIQTYEGRSDPEKTWKSNRKWTVPAAILFAAVALTCQLVEAVWTAS